MQAFQGKGWAELVVVIGEWGAEFQMEEDWLGNWPRLCLHEFLLSCLPYPKWPASYFKSLHVMPGDLLLGTPGPQEASE